MKPHPCLRKAATWSALAATLLLAAAWLATVWTNRSFGWEGEAGGFALIRQGTLALGRTRFIIISDSTYPRNHIRILPHWGQHSRWWPGYSSDTSGTCLSLPLWTLALPLALAAAAAFRAGTLARRNRAGHCPKCAYDLAGNTTGICPECGGPCTT